MILSYLFPHHSSLGDNSVLFCEIQEASFCYQTLVHRLERQLNECLI